MEKRPTGGKPVPPPKKPPAKSDPDSDVSLTPGGKIEPESPGANANLGETEVFAGTSAPESDDEAAGFLLDDEETKAPPQKAAMRKPVAPKPQTPPTPQDADTILSDEGESSAQAEKQGEPLGGTELFTESSASEEEEEAPTAPPKSSGKAPAAKPRDPAKPATLPAKGPPSTQTGGKTPTLGDYKILKKLGAGGMGSVFLAEQVSLQRHVALKVLSKELAAKEAFVQRFVREARVMAKLDHPNILRCFDAGAAHGYHYLVMEYADGGSVEGWLKKKGQFSIEDALHIILACARALEHAQELNMVHRDIKPDNLLLTGKGAVKLADLGLAKATDDDLSLTKTGTGAGTPLYMAPEQARDVKHVDGRSDIYSVGCMLYRFLAGQVPFNGETLVEVIDLKTKGKYKPLRAMNSEVTERLSLMVDKMLAANPAHRYQTCTELIQDLESLELAGERLSFIGAPAGGEKGRPPSRPSVPKTQRTAAAPPAKTSSRTSSAKAPTVDEPEEDVGGWWVNLPLPGGKTINKKLGFEDVVTLVKNGTLAVNTKLCRTQNGNYRPLNTFPELNQVMKAQVVKAEADRKGQKYREIYAKIEKEDQRRRRWRWLKGYVGQVGGFVGFLIWMAVVIGIIVGGFFLFTKVVIPHVSTWFENLHGTSTAPQTTQQQGEGE
jgi:serine/threonine-protein kinase